MSRPVRQTRTHGWRSSWNSAPRRSSGGVDKGSHDASKRRLNSGHASWMRAALGSEPGRERYGKRTNGRPFYGDTQTQQRHRRRQGEGAHQVLVTDVATTPPTSTATR